MMFTPAATYVENISESKAFHLTPSSYLSWFFHICSRFLLRSLDASPLSGRGSRVHRSSLCWGSAVACSSSKDRTDTESLCSPRPALSPTRLYSRVSLPKQERYAFSSLHPSTRRRGKPRVA